MCGDDVKAWNYNTNANFNLSFLHEGFIAVLILFWYNYTSLVFGGVKDGK